jgi:hypothetical protein
MVGLFFSETPDLSLTLVVFKERKPFLSPFYNYLFFLSNFLNYTTTPTTVPNIITYLTNSHKLYKRLIIVQHCLKGPLYVVYYRVSQK